MCDFEEIPSPGEALCFAKAPSSMESPSRSENDFNIDGSVRDFLVEPLHRITTTQALNDVDGLTCWIKTVVYQFYTWQRVPGGQGARAHA
mmetsp:Transcript_65447/g.128998  ORF Transcript_65447/g.128998 Transcript_65447/m.128998 type:complete len:90 (+) Transcript_65447:185-454(+)